MASDTITLAITGASGVQYGVRLLQCLLQKQQTVHLMVSHAAQVVAATETELRIPSQPEAVRDYFLSLFGARQEQLNVYSREQWMAPIASGSAISRAMVICPCSSSTLAAISMGLSNNLIERAADVTLKEKQQLIVVTRETPLSQIHLHNMLTLSQAGAMILPASPGFYHQPKKIEDLVDFVVARVLDQLGIAQDLVEPWANEKGHDKD